MVSQSIEIWDAAILSNTYDFRGGFLDGAGQIALQLRNVGFSGTIDIQGKAHGDAAQWLALPYYIADAAGPLELVVAQLSYTTETANHLLILPVVLPVMRLVMARTAGNISGYAYNSKTPSFLQFAGAAA